MPNPTSLRSTMVRTALAAAILGAGAESARAQTLNFSGLGLSSGGAIPDSYGDTRKVNVTNRTRVGFGNTAEACPHVGYWQSGYSSLEGVAFPCTDPSVAEFSFKPKVGYRVFVQALQLGSYPSNNGVGPTRGFDVRVYDWDWTLLVRSTGNVNEVVTLLPNVSSTRRLYLQYGMDWNVAADNIQYQVRRKTSAQQVLPSSTVPEPMSITLLSSGLVGVAAARRRRRKEAE